MEYCYALYKAYLMFSNNLYRIVQKDASTRNRIYIVISKNERGSVKEKMCERVCFANVCFKMFFKAIFIIVISYAKTRIVNIDC